MTRSRASYHRAALKGWRTRVRSSKIHASKLVIRPGERVRISWQAEGQEIKVGRVEVGKSGYKDFFPKQTTGYTLTARGYGQVSIRRITVKVEKNREYFVVLIFKTRKHGKTVTRRLYEAIITLPDRASEDEVLKEYQAWIQEKHPRFHNAAIERLLFGENRGRTIKIIPRDEPTAELPGVQLNDARNPEKDRTRKTGRRKRNKKT